MSRRHNDANVLCLSADLLGEELIERMLRIWLETEFESGRHARRVEKITRFEQQGPTRRRLEPRKSQGDRHSRGHETPRRPSSVALNVHLSYLS